jgi:hypothetical protein
VEVWVGGSQRLGYRYLQAHVARRLKQYLLVFQRLYLAFLVEHNPAALMVNVMLMETWVSRLALGSDALVLKGALVEVHEGGWADRDKDGDGMLGYLA